MENLDPVQGERREPLPFEFLERMQRLANQGLPATPKDVKKLLAAYLQAEAELVRRDE